MAVLVQQWCLKMAKKTQNVDSQSVRESSNSVSLSNLSHNNVTCVLVNLINKVFWF